MLEAFFKVAWWLLLHKTTMVFSLPVYEMLTSALISGGVTWATIYFTTKQAREQTAESLAQAREATEAAIRAAREDTDRSIHAARQQSELTKADRKEESLRQEILRISKEVQSALESGHGNLAIRPEAASAIAYVDRCGVRHATLATQWTIELTVLVASKKDHPAIFPLLPRRVRMLLTTPEHASTYVLERLSDWQDDPEGTFKEFQSETVMFREALRIRSERSMDRMQSRTKSSKAPKTSLNDTMN